MKKILIVAAVLSLAGCKSAADRMYQCEAQGISRDACYVAEQNRQATTNAAAEAQALQNANGLYGTNGSESKKRHHHHATQYAQAAHKRPSDASCEAITAIFTERGADGLSMPGKDMYNRCHPDATLTDESN